MNVAKKKMHLVLALAALLLPAAAQAQYYGVRGLPPLYPYELQPGQPYAVEVAPGSYVIHHPRRQWSRAAAKGTVVNTTTVVREKPIVIEHTRVVQDPPRVIVRRHEVVDAPAAPAANPRPRTATEITVAAKQPMKQPIELPAKLRPGRVIHADAEVTILGPDRMTIQLYRKGTLGAQASEKK